MTADAIDPALRRVLARSAALGHIGGDVEAHVRHAQAFASTRPRVPRRALDLGSGGGLPGLVLASLWPDSNLTLLDGSATRAAFLVDAVEELGWSPRVVVVGERAEVAGRDPAHRGKYDAVVARSFGPPAVVAECGAPFLAVDGALVVSEPPDDPDGRWAHPVELAELGLVVASTHDTASGRFQELRQERRCPQRYPRRTGIPAKRPLFD